MPYPIYAAGDSNPRPRTPVSLTDTSCCAAGGWAVTHSSSFQNSLLLAYVRGFLELFVSESCTDASGTFQNISQASGHVRTPFLNPEHPDTQPGTCSPANAACPYFRIRHPDLGSFGGSPTCPRMGTLGNLPRRTRTCPRMSSVTCACCCSSRGTCGRGGAG